MCAWAYFVCLPPFLPANFKEQAGRSQGFHNHVRHPKFRSPRCCVLCSQNRHTQCTFFSCFLKSRPLCDQTRSSSGFQCPLSWTLWTTLFARILQGLGPIPETTTWKQLNAFKNSFSCDLNKNATPPCCRAFTDDCWLYKGHFRTPQNDRTTIDYSSSYVKTLKSPDQLS